jgi:signal transduction histidine kinase
VRAAGAPVSVVIEGEPGRLPPDIDHAAYRILQESLTNVLRHAGPDASATVCLGYAPGTLTIRVTDNGTGASAADGGTFGDSTSRDSTSGGHECGGGHGLTGMSERAAAVGGELSAGPGPGGGFEVIARLPAANPDTAAKAGTEVNATTEAGGDTGAGGGTGQGGTGAGGGATVLAAHGVVTPA